MNHFITKFRIANFSSLMKRHFRFFSTKKCMENA